MDRKYGGRYDAITIVSVITTLGSRQLSKQELGDKLKQRPNLPWPAQFLGLEALPNSVLAMVYPIEKRRTLPPLLSCHAVSLVNETRHNEAGRLRQPSCMSLIA